MREEAAENAKINAFLTQSHREASHRHKDTMAQK
jgi:hypothetical protein